MSDTVFFLLPTNKLYKKENTRRLKNFSAGYVGNFYRNLAGNINTDSDFYSRIAADTDIPKDINHYVTRDRINDASFRQKLDPVGKNILRRQNPLELVFEDISTFDAENPIVGSLLRKIDIKKKQSDSDFIRSLPSHTGKEFEIQKRLDKLKGTSNVFNNNNNNNNNAGGGGNTGGTNLNLDNYGLNQPPPSLPRIEDFIDNGGAPPPPQPPSAPINQNLFNTTNPLSTPKTDFNVETKTPFILPTIWGNKGIGNDIFGSQAVMTGPREPDRPVENKAKQEIDDFLYELTDTGMPTLELGDKLIQTLGTEAENLFDPNAPPTKKEEEDEILKKIMDEYNIDDIKAQWMRPVKFQKAFFFFMEETVNNLLMLLNLLVQVL